MGIDGREAGGKKGGGLNSDDRLFLINLTTLPSSGHIIRYKNSRTYRVQEYTVLHLVSTRSSCSTRCLIITIAGFINEGTYVCSLQDY